MPKAARTYVDRRELAVGAPPPTVFRALCRGGGDHGWYVANWLWRLRGRLDSWVGGPGLARGRRDPERVAVGDELDFWRVVAVETDRRLALRAEMRLPGEALLEFTTEPLGDGSAPDRTRLVQTAWFLPQGFAGFAYWYLLLPFHALIFRGMLQGIQRAAEALAREGARGSP